MQESRSILLAGSIDVVSNVNNNNARSSKLSKRMRYILFSIGEFNPDTAYVGCISISLFFLHGNAADIYMKTSLLWMRRCYGLLWTVHCPTGCYFDVTKIWPLLFHGRQAGLIGTPINALATRIHGDHGSPVSRLIICRASMWSVAYFCWITPCTE